MSEQEARDTATSAEHLEELSNNPALRFFVASNPAAPAQLLETLATDQDAQVRAAVASNPNTPWLILEQLAPEFPHAFVHNPVASLQMAVRPEQITTNHQFWEHLLQETELTPLWWKWLRSLPASRVSQTVRLHVQYAGEAAHPFGVPEQEEAHDLLTLLELLSVALRQGAPLPQPPAEPQEGSSWATLESLMGKHWHSLAHHSDPEVRQAVAESWDTPMELLALLALDEDANVRQAVAGNEDAPVELLSLLASDKETQVQEAVARNERTPVEVLKALALDGDGYDVWVGLLSNSQTPREVVSILSEKGEEYVAWSARRIIESERAHEPFMQKPSLVQDRAGRVRSKKQTPEETLDTLAQDVYEVMVVVASDPQTPVEVVTALAEERVLFAAGKGSVEKPELLRDQHAGKRWLTNVNQRRLLWGKRRQYRAWFACLQQASVGTQWEIVASLDTPLRVRQAVFAALAFHWERKKIQSAFSESSFRWRIMAPFMPPIALQKLADSPCWEVRYLVAVREQTPAEARQRLCQDSNRYVRAMARAKTAQMGEKSMTETPEISC